MENIEIVEEIGNPRSKLPENYFRLVFVAGHSKKLPKINQIDLFENVFQQCLDLKNYLKRQKFTNINIYYLTNTPINFTNLIDLAKMFSDYKIKLFLN